MLNVSDWVFIKESLFKYHTFPQWESYGGLGTPIINNPLNSFFSPLVFIPFLILPFILATESILVLSIFLSGVFFYLLTRYFKIGKIISLLASMTYMASGFMSGRITAGHFEWILAYPLIPLFILFLLILLDKKNILWAGLLSLLITLILFCGNVYVVIYCLISISSVILFLFIKILLKIDTKDKIKRQIFFLIASLILTPFFSALKFFPMLSGRSYLIRNVNAFVGSQNIFSIVYNFFLPFPDLFKYFGLDKYIISSYLWWESYAYIGPFSLIGLMVFFILRKKINHQKIINPLIFLGFVLILFSFLGNPYSPFHWLFVFVPFFQNLRVPSRIFILIIPIVLILFALSLDYVYTKTNKIYIKPLIFLFLIINLTLVYKDFQTNYNAKGFPPINNNFVYLLNFLKTHDNSQYYIAQSVFFQNQLPTYLAIANHQKLFGGGWGKNNNPGEEYASADFSSNYTYKDVYPKYFIYPVNYYPPKSFNVKTIKEMNTAKLYENSEYTPYAYTTENINEIKLGTSEDSNIKSVTIAINKINVTAYSRDNQHKLVLLETYFPDWELRVDNKQQNPINNRFLAAPMKKGTHVYSFVFFSISFLIGIVVSLIAFTVWLILVLRPKLFRFGIL